MLEGDPGLMDFTQAAGVSEDCILARILEARPDYDGSSSAEDEVLKDAMATIYIGVFCYRFVHLHSD